MSHITITLELKGHRYTPDDVDRFADVLDRTEGLDAPAVGLDQETGALTVIANATPELADRLVTAMHDALTAAGARPDPFTVHVEYPEAA